MNIVKRSLNIVVPILLVSGAILTISGLKSQEKLSDEEQKQIQAFQMNPVVLSDVPQKQNENNTSPITTSSVTAAPLNDTQQEPVASNTEVTQQAIKTGAKNVTVTSKKSAANPVVKSSPQTTPSPVVTPQPAPQPEPQPVETPPSDPTGTTDPAVDPYNKIR